MTSSKKINSFMSIKAMGLYTLLKDCKINPQLPSVPLWYFLKLFYKMKQQKIEGFLQNGLNIPLNASFPGSGFNLRVKEGMGAKEVKDESLRRGTMGLPKSHEEDLRTTFAQKQLLNTFCSLLVLLGTCLQEAYTQEPFSRPFKGN